MRGKENGIQTSFVKRGRPFSEEKKGKDLVRKELARVRATAMEGSFGTQKEHYDLRRVKARTKLTEILFIFFGIHTANVVQLADMIEQRAQLAASWNENMHMEKCFHRGTTPLSLRIDIISGRNDRKEI